MLLSVHDERECHKLLAGPLSSDSLSAEAFSQFWLPSSKSTPSEVPYSTSNREMWFPVSCGFQSFGSPVATCTHPERQFLTSNREF